MSRASAAGRRPLPILFVTRQMDSGGLERDVAKLALGLDRRRFTPYVAAFVGGGLRWKELQQAGVPVFDLGVRGVRSPKILASFIRFVRIVLSKRIRLVHAYDASVVLVEPVARLLRVPVVLTAVVGHRDLLDEKTKRQLSASDKKVDGIVVNCLAMQRHLAEDYGVSPARIALCYNGVDTSQFSPGEACRPEALAGADLVIGSVCVLRPEKRLELLVEAFARIRGLASGVKLLIVGSGPELSMLQAKAAEHGVTADCVFLPAVPNVASLLRAIDIFVSCSSSEAFSNAILEAMACGCCVVGSAVGGTPELIKDGKRGLLFEPNNALDLSHKLECLLNEPDLRLRLAENAATFAAQDLNMQKALHRMSEIYEQQLTAKGENP